ncbi:MAG: MgtC/SapB family protein, partial [Clostridia bacterium]|nr:MgtC/SapB family protein [Clostridia bacterium]
MIHALDGLRTLTTGAIWFRLILAAICGSIIGLERSSKNRPAGFRTHVLVCIGAAAASMTGHYLYLEMGLPTDVTRIAAQIITGLSFLGAGTILVTKNNKVRGLTTAAGLWTTGIIGISIGSGFYEGGVICTGLVFAAEMVLGKLLVYMKRDSIISMELMFHRKDALDQMMRTCKDSNLAIKRLQVKHEDNEENRYYASLRLHVPWNTHMD